MFQSDQLAYGASGQYTGSQRPGLERQQAVQHTQPEHSVPEHAFAPPLPAQQGLYDPFAHADSPQDPPMPPESSDPPPLPPEEAPPLPLDDAPPLPAEPAEPLTQQQYINIRQSQQIPAPVAEHAQPAHQPETAWLQQAAPLQPWTTVQHPSYEAYAHQQPGWQQGPYAIPPSVYSQPAPIHQQHPWQPQQQQHVQHYPHAYPALAHSMLTTAAAEPIAAAPLAAAQSAAKIITDAASIFLQPGRMTRPKRLAIVLRGLPGSGKSHIARKLKDVETQQGGEAPRIHAIDDYFYTVCLSNIHNWQHLAC